MLVFRIGGIKRRACWCSPLLLLRFDHYLFRVSYDDFRLSSIRRDLSVDANLFSLVVVFGLSELASVFTPNHCGKNLVRVRLVEVEKGRLTL